jgi:hypothetical protein
MINRKIKEIITSRQMDVSESPKQKRRERKRAKD